MKVKLVNENFKRDWVDNILMSRGVAKEDIQKLKSPTIDFLNPPNNLENMEKAVSTIYTKIWSGEKIGLIFDSDLDGLTSGSIIYLYLHELNPQIDIVYFFHDHKQHGLEDCWEKFANAGVSCVICPDAGVNDKKYHDRLWELGIQTIVLDHHIYEGGGFSEGAIYVDNQISPKYTNKNLAGCGIAWQFCRGIDNLYGGDKAFKYIDLVALGCAGDVMSPLSPENSFIFSYGFDHITNPTFKSLAEKQSYSTKGIMNYTNAAFYIAPYINACMRTGTPEEKLIMYKMFIHPDMIVKSGKRGEVGIEVPILEEGARILTNVKSHQKKMIDVNTAALEGRIEEYGLTDNNIIVIELDEQDDFASELNGLLAMRISDKYHRPCMVIRHGEDGLAKGSVRNPNGSPIDNLKSLLVQSPYVEWALGHESAHGIALKGKCVDSFVSWFNSSTKDFDFATDCYRANLSFDRATPEIAAACWDIARNDRLWGGDNPKPVIYLQDFKIQTNNCKYIGKLHDTITFNIEGVNCIIFHASDLVKKWENLHKTIVIDCIGEPSINSFRGEESIQFCVREIEWHEESELDF